MKREKQLNFDIFDNNEEKFFDKNKTLIISFSGGRTSGYLTKRLLEHKDQWKDVIVIFANTGQEHEKTLDFIHNCDTHFDFNTVWIEAVISKEKGVGTRAKVVDYKTCSRDGEPFEDMIAKYGIPWSKSPICTRELKQYAIQSYLKELNIKKEDRLMAIGIRSDEASRMSRNAVAENLIYPLVEWNIDKYDVLDWWEDQIFDLQIPEHFGNCVWCWKKSYKKLMTIMIEEPTAFDFPERMEKKYGKTGAMAEHLGKTGVLKNQTELKFFRGFKSVQDIREMITEDFEKFTDLHHLHITDGCGESCEPWHSEENDNKIDIKDITK